MPTIASIPIQSFFFDWVKKKKKKNTDTVVKHTKSGESKVTQRSLQSFLGLALCYLLWLANFCDHVNFLIYYSINESNQDSNQIRENLHLIFHVCAIVCGFQCVQRRPPHHRDEHKWRTGIGFPFKVSRARESKLISSRKRLLRIEATI